MGCKPSKKQRCIREQPQLYFQKSRVINFERLRQDSTFSSQKISNRITNMKAYKNFSASSPTHLVSASLSPISVSTGDSMTKTTFDYTTKSLEYPSGGFSPDSPGLSSK